jgi:hypothetical protein
VQTIQNLENGLEKKVSLYSALLKFVFIFFRIVSLVWVWLLISIILATWEAEIRRTAFEARPGKKFRKPTPQPIKAGYGTHICHSTILEA